MKITCNLEEYTKHSESLIKTYGLKQADFDITDGRCMKCGKFFKWQGLRTYDAPTGETVFFCRDCYDLMNQAINSIIISFTRANPTNVKLQGVQEASVIKESWSIKEAAALLKICPATLRALLNDVGHPIDSKSRKNRITREVLDKVRAAISEKKQRPRRKYNRIKFDDDPSFIQKRDKLFDTFDWDAPRYSYQWKSPKDIKCSDSAVSVSRYLASLARNNLIDHKYNPDKKKDGARFLYLLPKQKI